jgi:hypothetical protein
VQSDEDAGYINLCLKAWGNHPFTEEPQYRKYSSVLNLFGIGQNTDDLAPTKKPALVLIDTGVNVLGGTTLRLMNPNGWYCFRSNINVMGKVTIKAHCQAHLASASDGLTIFGEDQHNKSTTVLGQTQVELIGCEDPAADAQEVETEAPPTVMQPKRSKKIEPLDED